ncbi:hypothetical protein J2S40_000179 [Nocardioides luteus]|uniref:hypothetical protein n=1 Tax=Nocardioides luteus TaxID=1844 RepID=UPI0016652802|nr:hypothetical protein [Nocardioides luteus]MDR7309121.1 hypothetical protein [Nocardioides luteus]
MVARSERNEARTYHLVRLYLAEIEEIERVLADLGPDAGSVKISNGEWEAETIAELAAKGEGPFSKFTMKRYDPGLLSFETSGVSTRLYVSNTDDLQLRGAFEKINSILVASQRPLLVRWFHSAPMWGVLVGLGVVAGATGLGAVVGMFRGDGPPGWLVPTCIAVLAFACLIVRYQYRTSMHANGLVYLVPKSARPSFFVRKRDDIAIALIGGVFGAVFGSILTLLVQRP